MQSQDRNHMRALFFFFFKDFSEIGRLLKSLKSDVNLWICYAANYLTASFPFHLPAIRQYKCVVLSLACSFTSVLGIKVSDVDKFLHQWFIQKYSIYRNIHICCASEKLRLVQREHVHPYMLILLKQQIFIKCYLNTSSLRNRCKQFEVAVSLAFLCRKKKYDVYLKEKKCISFVVVNVC